jgi:hypothetical protein
MYTIVNIRRGHGLHTYAEVHDAHGQVCVSATLAYCVQWIDNKL